MAANTMTSSQTHPTTHVPERLLDTSDIKDILVTMRGSWSNITQNYNQLNEQFPMLLNSGPTMRAVVRDIQNIHEQIQSRVEGDDKELNGTKQEVQEVLKGRIINEMKAHLDEEVKSQIAQQVSDQIATQIKGHLPVTLKDQLQESKSQLEKAKKLLDNSDARLKNSVLRVNRDCDHNKLLHDVYNVKGNHSRFFPPNLKALFELDLKTSQSLVKDYKLPMSEIKEENFNIFMAHIGIKDSLAV